MGGRKEQTVMLKKYETREQYVAEVSKYLPACGSVVRAGLLERGWRAHCRLHDMRPYPSTPPKTEPPGVAAGYVERARAQAEGLLQVCPTIGLSRAELMQGVLAELGRDEQGRLR